MKCHRLGESDPARIRNCCKNLILFCVGNESRGVRPEGDPFGHLAPRVTPFHRRFCFALRYWFIAVEISIYLIDTFVKHYFIVVEIFFLDFISKVFYNESITKEEVYTMSTIAERIKKVRKDAGLTQQKFAERIGAKQNTVAQYEIGRNAPIDPVITAICKEFDVQEDWLKYGLEPMRAAKSREEEIADLVGSALTGSSEFKKSVIRMICSRTDEELKALEAALQAVYDGIKKGQG